MSNQALIDASAIPDRSYDKEELNPPWRLDPLQNIVNVKWLNVVGRIAVITGYPGNFGTAAWFSVVNGRAKMFAQKVVFSQTGDQFYTVINPVQQTLALQTAQPWSAIAIDGVANWEGQITLAPSGVLYSPPGTSNALTPPAAVLFDKTAKPITSETDLPARGLLIGSGIFATTQSVASYDTENHLIWIEDELDVELVLLEGGVIKVLGAPGGGVITSVTTIDPVGGDILSELDIGTGDLHSWDCASNGDSYAVVSVGDAWSVRCYSITGTLRWEHSLTAGGDEAGVNVSNFQSIAGLAVIEDEDENTFVVVLDCGEMYGNRRRTDGVLAPPFGFQDFNVKIFDSDGVAVSQTLWGTSESNYAEPGIDANTHIFEGVTRAFTGIALQLRYPDPATP